MSSSCVKTINIIFALKKSELHRINITWTVCSDIKAVWGYCLRKYILIPKKQLLILSLVNAMSISCIKLINTKLVLKNANIIRINMYDLK